MPDYMYIQKILCSCVFLDTEQALVDRLQSDVKQKRSEVESMSKELEEMQSSILQQLVVHIAYTSIDAMICELV